MKLATIAESIYDIGRISSHVESSQRKRATFHGNEEQLFPYVYIHVKFWKCQCGRFIRKSEGVGGGGGNGILYVNRRLLENGAIICKLGF